MSEQDASFGSSEGVGAAGAPSVLDDRPDQDPLGAVVLAQKSGVAAGITSVCSAHPLVLEAAVQHAQDLGTALLVEATSNQVDQDGGYTGLTPEGFRDLVLGIAATGGLPADRLLLGGDHLGPNRWRHLPAAEAMQHAGELVAAYVEAGFRKIHLDCTFACAGESEPLSDTVVAGRTAELMGAAEDAHAPGAPPLRYVIGTEVPPPGGERKPLASVAPTDPQAARTTLLAHRAAFEERGLGGCWGQVCALVVQPGVDFDQMGVSAYDRHATRELREVLDAERGIVFEAHSTDYQTPAALRALVEDHWAILKVGPALTFGLREALFALSAIERELIEEPGWARLPEVLERAMTDEPAHWRNYYTGSAREQRLARRYSYSDRLRYYWPHPAVAAAQQQLLHGLEQTGVPEPLVSQFLPAQYERIRRGQLTAEPRALVLDRVRDVLRDYSRACGSDPAPAARL